MHCGPGPTDGPRRAPRRSAPAAAGEQRASSRGAPPFRGRGQSRRGLREHRDGAKLHRTYLALVGLAAIVAAIGLANDNTAAVIGAMVVAPLLGPQMAIALGLVLGDGTLVRRALITAFAGFSLTLLLSLVLGAVLGVDPATPEIASRARVDI
jgi:uncharacterized membrane protein